MVELTSKTSLKLIKYSKDVFTNFFDLVSDEEVMKYVDGALSRESAKALFSSFLNNENRAWGVFIGNQYVGHAALVEESNDTDEFLVYIKKNFWRAGVGTSAAKALLEIHSENYPNRNLVATLDVDNIGSQKMCESVVLA